MLKGVDLLLLHCADVADRPPARERLETLLGEELTLLLLNALGRSGSDQVRGGRLLTSSSPYSLT